MLFEENAIFDRKATSAAHRSISTVSRSTALIWLKMPEYVALFAPTVYFGGLAQSTAVSGYDLPAYAAALGLGLGVEPAQALKMIAAEPNTAHSGNLLVRDMR
jgi:hypothetical protein